MVENQPADTGDLRGTVQSLGWEDPLEDMAIHSSVLAWRVPMDRGAWRAAVHSVTRSQTPLKQPCTHADGSTVPSSQDQERRVTFAASGDTVPEPPLPAPYLT